MANGNYCFLTEIECKGGSSVEYRAVQVDSDLKMISDTKFEIEEERLENIRVTFTEQNIFFSCTHPERERVKGKVLKQNVDYMHLYKININEGETVEVDMKKSLEDFEIGYFSVVISEDRLILSGQVYENEGFRGVFTGVLDENTLNVSDIRTHKFSDDFVTQFWSEKKKEKDDKKRKRKGEDGEDRDFGDQFRFVNTFAAGNGGTYTVYQKFWWYLKTVTTTDSKGNTTTREIPVFNYGDILLLKSGTLGEIEYTKLIPCLQVTQNVDPGIGFRVIQNKDGLYFLHMATIDNDNDLYLTHVDLTGEFTSKYVMDPNDEKIIVSADKIFVDRNRQQFVLATHVARLRAMKESILLIISI
jgi:hypothetical protein